MKRPSTSVEAHLMKLKAQEARLIADEQDDNDDFLSANISRAIACENEKFAEGYLNLVEPPQLGTGGELLPVEAADRLKIPIGYINTIEHPDRTILEASGERIELAGKAGCYEMALDAAESIQARNSLEKMLAHQAAAAHKLAMIFAATAEKWLAKGDPENGIDARKVTAMQEAQRAANSSARMMKAFDDGLLTLAKARSGGEQKVTVVHQHLQVAGGHVAVTGHISQAGGRNDGGE